jgi:hypothetical protein
VRDIFPMRVIKTIAVFLVFVLYYATGQGEPAFHCEFFVLAEG